MRRLGGGQFASPCVDNIDEAVSTDPLQETKMSSKSQHSEFGKRDNSRANFKSVESSSVVEVVWFWEHHHHGILQCRETVIFFLKRKHPWGIVTRQSWLFMESLLMKLMKFTEYDLIRSPRNSLPRDFDLDSQSDAATAINRGH